MSDDDVLTATRLAYDTVAEDYARLLADELAGQPWDRALLGVFAELVRAGDLGPVADLGCGPGRVTAHLAGLGVDVFGVDLSPEMVRVAGAAHPQLSFREGSITALDLPDASLGGLVAWYSVIHLPPGERPGAWSELCRVLAPNGRLLLAFQVGDERLSLTEAYGHRITLDAYRLSPERVTEELTAAGLVVDARTVRKPEGQEKTPQAYLLGHKPVGTTGGR